MPGFWLAIPPPRLNGLDTPLSTTANTCPLPLFTQMDTH
jgi:hypothetical protein